MRLGVIFVITLAVSVIVSSTATWGLTFSTSYSELRNMSDGFVQVTTLAVDSFAQMVWQLITDTGDWVSTTLETEHQRTMGIMNQTQLDFLHSTIDLMGRTRNATAQAQSLVVSLLLSFGDFIGTVIDRFQVVGTDYASRLRIESASRAQANFQTMMQDRIYSLKRQARLYEWGVLNLSRTQYQPQDEGSCTLFGLLCSASAEVQRSVLIGTARGNLLFCDVTDQAYSIMVYPGPTADNVILPLYTPFNDNNPDANYSKWKASCLAGFTNSTMNVTCAHGTGMEYPDHCNNTCGFDPRCRLWYTIHLGSTTPKTQMTNVYIDIHRKVPVVALTYPIFSGSPPTLVAAVATDFFFEEVDAFLSAMGAEGNSQLIAVILNSSDLLVVGTSRGCTNGSTVVSTGGVPIANTCEPVLRGLSGWLMANRALTKNVSFELSGTLWDVFPSTVDTFTYFVAVGMNKSEVFAVVDATNRAANLTLRNLSQQQAARMAASEASALAEMDAVAVERIAAIQAQQASLEQYAKELHIQTVQQFNLSRQQSTTELAHLITAEMASISSLKDYHLSQMTNSIGMTFGAVVGIFVGILLGGSYGTWIVSKQVHNITVTMEDVANMKVEQLQVTQKSSVGEVQRIATALGILVERLAEYKSYMPAGLFQQEELQVEEAALSPCSPANSTGKRGGGASPIQRQESSSTTSKSTGGRRSTTVAGVGNATRLLRRNVAAMVVNISHFQGEVGVRSAAQMEAVLNRFISTIHRLASKAQGNIDAILGDQVLLTFNAHFSCSDPPVTASYTALEMLAAFKEEFPSDLRIRIGVAAGAMYSGHLGYAQFKAMVALGAPMKVASLLAHLSDFEAHTVLVCPSVAERIKYHFTLQPVDLLSLPQLGEHVGIYAKGINVSILVAHDAAGRESQEWLYEVKAAETTTTGDWNTTFQQVAKASSIEKAQEHLEQYLHVHPEDRLACRLRRRLAYWQPRLGIVVAQRPDVPPEAANPGSPAHAVLSLSL